MALVGCIGSFSTQLHSAEYQISLCVDSNPAEGLTGFKTQIIIIIMRKNFVEVFIKRILSSLFVYQMLLTFRSLPQVRSILCQCSHLF